MNRSEVSIGENEIICFTFRGDLTDADLEEVLSRGAKIMTAYRLHDKPVLMLADVSELGKREYLAQKRGLRTFKEWQFDKVAVFGGSPAIRYLVNSYAKLAGKNHTIRHLATRAEAVTWLKKILDQ